MKKLRSVGVKGYISFAVTISLMYVIFLMSGQDGEASASLSLRVTEAAADIVFTEFESLSESVQSEIIKGLHGFIRKLAHFCAYAALGMSVFVSYGFIIKKKSRIAGSFCVCVLYAAADEIHQLFVDGRAGMIKDVFIDSLGAATGVFVAVCVCAVCEAFKNQTFSAI